MCCYYLSGVLFLSTFQSHQGFIKECGSTQNPLPVYSPHHRQLKYINWIIRLALKNCLIVSYFFISFLLPFIKQIHEKFITYMNKQFMYVKLDYSYAAFFTLSMHVHRQRASCHLLTVCTASEYTPRQLHLLPLVGIVCKSLWLQDLLSHEYSFVHDTVLLLEDGDGDTFCTILWWKVIHLLVSVMKKWNWWSHLQTMYTKFGVNVSPIHKIRLLPCDCWIHSLGEDSSLAGCYHIYYVHFLHWDK